jgi:hypothetical protein
LLQECPPILKSEDLMDRNSKGAEVEFKPG